MVNKSKTKILVFITISFILIPIVLSGCIQENRDDNNDNYEITLYELNYTQNITDYSYYIFIEDIENDPLSIEKSKINIKANGSLITNRLLFIKDYLITKEIIFKFIIEYNDSKPYSEQEYINLSLYLTFLDNDNDNYLSKDDSFNIIIKNKDENKFFNYSKLKIEIQTYKEQIIGNIFLEEIPDSFDNNNEGINE